MLSSRAERAPQVPLRPVGLAAAGRLLGLFSTDRTTSATVVLSAYRAGGAALAAGLWPCEFGRACLGAVYRLPTRYYPFYDICCISDV